MKVFVVSIIGTGNWPEDTIEYTVGVRTTEALAKELGEAELVKANTSEFGQFSMLNYDYSIEEFELI